MTRRVLTLLCIVAAIAAPVALAGARDGRALRQATADPTRVICETFGPGCRYAIRIASCETGGTFDPFALGRAGERGWFQIHPVHFRRTLRSSAGRIFVDPARLWQPRYNARVAYVLSNGGRDWRPWSCARRV